MTVADNLRSIATEAEPLIEQSLDVAEQIAALRKAMKEAREHAKQEPEREQILRETTKRRAA